MTDHTIEAHISVSANVGNTFANTERDMRIIAAVAAALGGENASHPLVLFEAAKIYRAVTVILDAIAKEAS